MEAELERLLIDDGKQVALARKSAEVFRGDNYAFGIGVMNTGPGKESFSLTVELGKAIDKQKQLLDVDKSLAEEWLLYDNSPRHLEQWESNKIGILVSVPKDALMGEYIFNARFYKTDSSGKNEQYGNTLQIIVIVK